MNAVYFDYPQVLIGLVLLIPLFFYDNFSLLNKRIRSNLPKPLRKRFFLSKFSFRVFIVCSVIAIAGPRWGVGQAAGQVRRGVDVVISVDVSRSMEVLDGDEAGSVSRLERGLSIVKDAIAAVPEVRYGAAIGRSRGVVAVPLTWNTDVVMGFLEALASLPVTGRGTNLEALLDAAATAFQDSQPSARAIVLVSDGEALSGSLRAAVRRCNERNISVIAVAVGSENGGEVPGTEGGPVSRRDSSAMMMAAGQTGGIYIDGNRLDAHDILASHLRSLAPQRETAGIGREPAERWFLFAAIAIAALCISKLSLKKITPEKKDE